MQFLTPVMNTQASNVVSRLPAFSYEELLVFMYRAGLLTFKMCSDLNNMNYVLTSLVQLDKTETLSSEVMLPERATDHLP
jgi:hypothetical protein